MVGWTAIVALGPFVSSAAELHYDDPSTVRQLAWWFLGITGWPDSIAGEVVHTFGAGRSEYLHYGLVFIQIVAAWLVAIWGCAAFSRRSS
ncbi:hypothetical protein EU803_16265 [Loktanella sp. IMCC34160]|nr:hypothetical protein EU803_16265 [Loktanella sp. IMCC34160]